MERGHRSFTLISTIGYAMEGQLVYGFKKYIILPTLELRPRCGPWVANYTLVNLKGWERITYQRIRVKMLSKSNILLKI